MKGSRKSARGSNTYTYTHTHTHKHKHAHTHTHAHTHVRTQTEHAPACAWRTMASASWAESPQCQTQCIPPASDSNMIRSDVTQQAQQYQRHPLPLCGCYQSHQSSFLSAKSNHINSNQIKSHPITSNQIKSNQIQTSSTQQESGNIACICK